MSIGLIEVDHPATQALKHQRLAMPGRAYPGQLHFVPIDFVTRRLSDVLRQSAYDPRQKSFFSWLGVTYYLTREVVCETLRDVAAVAPQGSVVVFDYMNIDAFRPGRAARSTAASDRAAGRALIRPSWPLTSTRRASGARRISTPLRSRPATSTSARMSMTPSSTCILRAPWSWRADHLRSCTASRDRAQDAAG